MVAVPVSVPGVVVQAELDRPRTWRGRWRGEEVDVVVAAVSDEPAVREAAVAALHPLVGVAPGCLAAVLCHEGVAVVGVPVRGRSVGALPPLEPGHAVGIGVAVAAVLERLHARGLVWGGSFDEVLVADDGTVGLPLHGLVTRRLAGERRTPRDDVGALAGMLRRRCPALGVPEDPGDARALAKALRRAARPRSLRLSGTPGAAAAVARPARPRRTPGARSSAPSAPRPPGTPLPRRPKERRARRAAVAAVVAAVGAVAVALVAAAGVVARGRDGSRTPVAQRIRSSLITGSPAVAVAGSEDVDWPATVAALDRARAAALAGHGDLAAADAPQSQAWADDTAVATRLAAAAPGTVPPVEQVTAVTVLRSEATVAVLQVTDTLPAYAYVDATGRTLQTVPARAARTWTVALVRTGIGWRLASIT